jgi:uncharacterized protein
MTTLLEKGRLGKSLASYDIVDMHAHLYAGASLGRTAADDLVWAMDRMGVKTAVVSSLRSGDFRIELCNEEMLAAMKKYPGRLMGYAYVWAGDGKAAKAEVLKRLKQGFVGIKMHECAGFEYMDAGFAPAFEVANERGLPVLLHTYGGQHGLAEQGPKLASRYKGAKLILAHAGAQKVEEHIKIANDHENVWLEICTSSCTYSAVATLAANAPNDRIVWGSDDLPLNMCHQVGKVLGADIPEAVKKKILSTNARRLLASSGK